MINRNCYDRKQLNYMDFLVIAKIERLCLCSLLLSECIIIIIINMFSRVFGIIATMQQQNPEASPKNESEIFHFSFADAGTKINIIKKNNPTENESFYRPVIHFVVIFPLFDVQPRDNFIFVMDNLIFVEFKIVVNNRELKKK